ncbi:PREDICTED: uncharacterized protein LOC107071201 [Polistes dominula]|uniref:Uncharacterized protein LOC107071201 n=1 Tax=Polistes dominula TaxID=743375 RepID=A0ABM1IZ38_POLDO|nr:PREDICTED: uncharacterized protein LOC107071201 [Polistes dominula]
MYMDEDSEQLLDYLRKKSRTLLAFTETNSKKINNEIQRLNQKNSLKLRRQNCYLKDRKEIWNLRNDSSAVNNLLCPEYHSEIKNLTTCSSVPNMRPLERIVIPSKNLSHSHCVVSRKPVKECYCNVEIKKLQTRSPRTIHKPTPSCNYCKNHICHVPLTINENNIGDTLSPPISCETIRRVQKINYHPQSQFLRNVQKKVSVLKNVPSGDCPDSCPRSSYYHKLRTDKTSMVMDTNTRPKIVTEQINKSSDIDLEKLSSTQRVSSSLIDEEEEGEEEEEEVEEEVEEEETETKVIEKVSKGIQVPSRKQSKSKFQVRRTISSKKCISEGCKGKSVSRSPSIGKKTVKSSTVDCQCYDKSKEDKFSKDLETYRVYSEDYEDVDDKLKKWSSHEKVDQRKALTSPNSKVKELRKFREENYFDTHGSSQTLLSSDSSKSLQQYTLNDRLFAEPFKRIHKKDLVVTMPPCATIQKKRVHYFPRYIVRQEKNNCNTNYKKKRCQSCPLTGHAIDLGISKPRPVLNSLALKYQKRLP